MASKEKEDRTGISFNMDSKTNDLLEKACRSSNRTKKKEVELRLADHLRRYEYITRIGSCVDFNESGEPIKN